MAVIQWQVTEMTANHERGVYTLERDVHGVWDLYFLPRHREWPEMKRIALVDCDSEGNARDFTLEEALMFAERHSEQFVVQMKLAAGG